MAGKLIKLAVISLLSLWLQVSASLASSDLRLVRVGLLELSDLTFADYYQMKAMFPVVAKGHLIFLLINEETGRKGDIAYSIPITKLLDMRSWVPKANFYRVSSEDSALGIESSSVIFSIFADGHILVQEELDKSQLVNMTSSRLETKKVNGNVRDFKGLMKGNREVAALMLRERGLFLSKRKIFSCGDPVSFSEKVGKDGNRKILVNFLDDKNAPKIARINLQKSHSDCSGEIGGFEPHFSQNAKFFSTLVKKSGRSAKTNLHIYRYEDNHKLRVVEKVKLFDIKIHDFRYKNSVSWASASDSKQFLYYIPDSPRNRRIGRVDCDPICKKPRLFKSRSCYFLKKAETSPGYGELGPKPPWKHEGRYDPETGFPVVTWVEAIQNPCVESTGTKLPMIEVSEIIWAVPFLHQKQKFIAAQAITRSSDRSELQDLETIGWSSRILIFADDS